jgi:PadR family transcriptional regulator AphA
MADSVEYSIMEYQSPRSFPVDLAALGFLIERPLHGYDLHQRMKAALGPVWRIALSQLYNVLHRLEQNGWIACREEPQEGAPPRRVCQATDEGIRAFRTWSVSPVEHLRDLRVEFVAKLYLLRRGFPEAVPELLAAQMKLLRGTLDALAQRKTIESDDPAIGAVVLAFRRHQLASAISWLEASREVLCGSKEER